MVENSTFYSACCSDDILSVIYSAAEHSPTTTGGPFGLTSFSSALGAEAVKTAGLQKLEIDLHLTHGLLIACNGMLERGLAAVHRLPEANRLPDNANELIGMACTSCTASATILQRHLAAMQAQPAAFRGTQAHSPEVMQLLHQLCMTAPACLRYSLSPFKLPSFHMCQKPSINARNHRISASHLLATTAWMHHHQYAPMQFNLHRTCRSRHVGKL